MANITASDVNKLRQITGSGMMDCKKALIETDGDFEKAIDFLRKKGQKVAANRADKEASEGIVIAKTKDNIGAILKINCETDFVAKNEMFQNFAHEVIDSIINFKPTNIEELFNVKVNNLSIKDKLDEIIGKIGEKIEIEKFNIINAPKVTAYNHLGNRVASLVAFNKTDVNNIDEISKEIAMQIVAMSALFIDKQDVSKEVLDREIEIAKEQAMAEGKPAEMAEKIALGKIEKFYKEATLLNQEFVRDPKITVRKYLEQHDKDLKVISFYRYQVK